MATKEMTTAYVHKALPAQVDAFGANGKQPQTAVTVNAACTDLATAVALLNQVRAALIANGLLV